MRDEQEQSIKEKASPPREDPRIDVLIGAYRNLAVKVDLLQEQIQEQEKELTRQDKRLADAILAEAQRKRIPEEEGHAPPAACSEPMPDKLGEKREPVGQESKPQHSASAKAGPKKGRAWKIMGECVFYGLLLLLILSAVFVRTTSDGSPRSLAGYSGMIVLTESMQSEIPKGSLVIAKTVDPGHAADWGTTSPIWRTDHLCHPPDRGYYRELREHGAEGVHYPGHYERSAG